jgi:RNA polymerase sigma factor (sigma-70 family)
MSDPNDDELIARYQQGDEQAFRELVDRYKNLVFAVVARSAVNPSRVEDLAQEVFLRIHRGLPYFRGDAKLTTWIYRIVFNLLSQEAERRRNSREVPLDPGSPGHEPRTAIAASVISSCAIGWRKRSRACRRITGCSSRGTTCRT